MQFQSTQDGSIRRLTDERGQKLLGAPDTAPSKGARVRILWSWHALIDERMRPLIVWFVETEDIATAIELVSNELQNPTHCRGVKFRPTRFSAETLEWEIDITIAGMDYSTAYVSAVEVGDQLFAVAV